MMPFFILNIQEVFSGGHLVDEGPDVLSALFCLGGERDQDVLFFHSEAGADEFYLLLDLAALDLVELCGDDDRTEAVVIREDFPTFDFPAKANSGSMFSGSVPVTPQTVSSPTFLITIYIPSFCEKK